MALMSPGATLDSSLSQSFSIPAGATSLSASLFVNLAAVDVSGDPFCGKDFDFGTDSLTVSFGGVTQSIPPELGFRFLA